MSATGQEDRLSPLYAFTAFGLALAAPALCIAFDAAPLAASGPKWLAIWTIGVRLGLAGLRQSIDPGFTALKIFGVSDKAALPIVREVGFANLSFAALGLASALVPSWRLAALLAGGVYFGLAAGLHLVRWPATKNEMAALVSDVLVFLALAAAFIAGLA